MCQKTICSVCKKQCRKNQRFKQCCVCRNFTHQKCSNLSPAQFSCVTGPQGKTPFTCVECTVHTPTSVQSLLGEHSYQNFNILNKQLKSKGVGDLFILHINIVSLVANFDEIKSLISNTFLKPDFICVTETRLKDRKIRWQSGLVNLPNYKLKYDNSKTSAGGVAIYVNEELTNFEVKTEMKFDVPDCESLFIEVKFKVDKTNSKNIIEKTVLIGCVYRHPRWLTSAFIDKLCEKLSPYTDKNIPIVTLGDTNINILEKSDRDKNYVNMLMSIGCQNLIDVPTCFADASRSCLDHIITNVDQDNITHGVLDYSPTNHLPIYAILRDVTGGSTIRHKSLDVNTKWRCIDDRKKEEFLNILAKKLSNIDLTKGPETILTALTEKTQEVIDICFPLKSKSNRAKKTLSYSLVHYRNF